MFPQKNGDFTFFTLKNLSLIMNLTKFFAWKNTKTCIRRKIEGLNNKADYYWAYLTSCFLGLVTASCPVDQNVSLLPILSKDLFFRDHYDFETKSRKSETDFK